IYFQPKNTEPIYAKLAGVKVLENNARYAKVELRHELTLPVRADDVLEQEQKGIVEFMTRSAGRSSEVTSMILTTELTVFADSPQLRFKTRFTNTAKDHRIRVLF
ncbi:alpha-mannosidase, partial [Streptococcus gordonii]|nr:alpha-mannosidase [Streptococcus gordonii]